MPSYFFFFTPFAKPKPRCFHARFSRNVSVHRNMSQSIDFQPIRKGPIQQPTSCHTAFPTSSTNYHLFIWGLNKLLLKFVVIDLSICQWPSSLSGIFGARASEESHRENQNIVSSMDSRTLPDSSRLRQFGVEAVQLDNGRRQMMIIIKFQIDRVIKSNDLTLKAQNTCERLKSK